MTRLSSSVAWSNEGAPAILARYEGLVIKTARSMRQQQSSGHCLDVDDLVAEGRVAVLEAVATYDGYGTNEFGWVLRRVRHRMLDAIRRLDMRSRRELREVAARRLSGVVSSDLLAARHIAFARDESDFMPRDGNQEEDAAAKEVAAIVLDTISDMTGKERIVADALVLHGESMAEVAERLSVTVARVSQIFQSVRDTLRYHIESSTA